MVYVWYLLNKCISTINMFLLLTDNNLTDGERMIKDISTEVAKLQQAYKTAIKTRNELKQALAKEASQLQLTKWELEHQKRRREDYERQADKIQSQITGLKSHIPLISEYSLKHK